eukprot:12737875-Ditylum_brightwellii.AAC.1
MRILAVTRSAVVVLTSNGHSTLSPPTTNCARFGSAFWGLWLQTMLPYVADHPFGISSLGIKYTVLVP